MQQPMRPRSETGFWYQFNMCNNNATYWFGRTQAGVIFLPHLNENQMNIEAAIELLRMIERAYNRYYRRLTGTR